MNHLEPVAPEDLARLDQLQVAKRGIADRLLELKEEEVRLIAAAKRVSDEWNGLFARIAQERGLDPKAEISINPKTGLVESSQSVKKEAPAEKPAAEAEPVQEEKPAAEAEPQS